MSEPRPFTIAVPDADLNLLHRQLALTRFPDELDEAGWAYGVPLADVRRLAARWKDGYDWRANEAEVNNTCPQFTRNILVDGFGTLNVHYVHQRSTVSGAIPMLFVHGWPGHFLEVKKILPLLTDVTPESPSFHVVALSLPNFGFSQGVSKKGFKTAQYAEVGNKLMLSLGYNEYITQGGDWGHIITRKMAEVYGPNHVKAWHTNMPIAAAPALTSNPILWFQHAVAPYTAAEWAGLQRMIRFRKVGQGYSGEQSTQPQTLGYALTDSPLVNWTDAYPWTDDEVLTWVSVYWFSRAGPAASLRIYYEIMGETIVMSQVKTVPCGISFFPKELAPVPKVWARTVGDVVFESSHNSGGHFAAYEKPQELVGDIKKMFGKKGPAFGIIKGKTGYRSFADARL